MKVPIDHLQFPLFILTLSVEDKPRGDINQFARQRTILSELDL